MYVHVHVYMYICIVAFSDIKTSCKYIWIFIHVLITFLEVCCPNWRDSSRELIQMVRANAEYPKLKQLPVNWNKNEGYLTLQKYKTKKFQNLKSPNNFFLKHIHNFTVNERYMSVSNMFICQVAMQDLSADKIVRPIYTFCAQDH